MDQWPSSEETSTSPNHHNVHSIVSTKSLRRGDQAVKRGRQALSIADRAPYHPIYNFKSVSTIADMNYEAIGNSPLTLGILV